MLHVKRGLVYLAAESITILRRVLLDCVITTHEAKIRENSVEKMMKMPVSYYSRCLSGEKTAQMNWTVKCVNLFQTWNLFVA